MASADLRSNKGGISAFSVGLMPGRGKRGRASGARWVHEPDRGLGGSLIAGCGLGVL